MTGALPRDYSGLRPALQLVAPIGGMLTLANRGDHATLDLLGPDGASTSLPLRSNSDRLLNLRQAGLWEIRSASTRGPAWVVVPPSPYAAVVGPDGHLTLADVPPGRYTLVVIGMPSAPGRAPRLVRAAVVVKASAAAAPTRITVRLPAR
jgi:hypothetical protein